MTDGQPAPKLDGLYELHREPLYRAMVLVTDDRDVSLEAVDRAFARTSTRSLRRSPHPEAVLLAKTVAFAGKRRRGEGMRGFRLPDAHVAAPAAAVVAALRRLALEEGVALVASTYLDWDDDAVVTAAGPAGSADSVAGMIAALAGELGLDQEHARPTIATALGEVGAAVARPLSRLESVKSESRVHRLGVAAGAAAVLLLVVGGSALGVRALRTTENAEAGPVPATAAGSDTSSASATRTATTAAPVAFDDVTWVQSGLPFRQGDISTATAGAEGFIAIGNDYSDPTGNGLRLLFSESGFDWAVVESPLPRNAWMQSLVYEGGRYIGVGSRFDEVGGGGDTPVVIVSEDGNAWEVLNIPVERTIEIEGMSIRVYTSVNAASAHDDELVVVGTQHSQEDLFQLIADSLPEDLAGNRDWGIGPNGLEFYDFQGNLIRTISADELGISAELFALISSGRPVVWRSNDGGLNWEEESLGAAFGSDAWLGQVLVADETMLALVYGRFGGTVWSNAGGEWSPIDLGRGVTLNSIGRFGDELIISGADASASRLWTSDDGAEWTAIEGVDFEGVAIERLVSSPHGVVAIGQAGQNIAIGPAIVETDDGFVVEIDQNGRYVVSDAEGNIVLELFGNEIQIGEEGGVVLADPETGETVVTLDQRQIDDAWEIVYRSFEEGREFGPEAITWAMFLSRDGKSWTRIDADEFGVGFYPNLAVLGTDRILVTGWQETGAEGGPRVWVGELTSD